mgnify:CR=1 FL=1
MATIVHLPKPLLDAVDRRARALKIMKGEPGASHAST